MYRCAERYMTMGPLVSQVRDEGDAGRQRLGDPAGNCCLNLGERKVICIKEMVLD